MAANSVWYTVVSVFVVFVGVTGLGLLFVRGSRIERNALVGTLTLATAILAGLILYLTGSESFTPSGLVMVALLSITGFAFGRGLDWWLGARSRSRDARNATLGADLAD